MFRHKGKNRTFAHNLRLANLLSFVAGLVNITGVLALKTLTTNVTVHFAFFMLLAMGIQNSLVTNISSSTVRTTHLKGLFTDLGIELSQLFFYKKPEEVKKLRISIFLRLSIITFFFLGCFSGGIIYQILEIKHF